MTSTGTEILFEVRESEDGGFWARALGADIVTEADTWGELVDMVRDAIKGHFDDESARPKEFRLWRQPI